MTSLFTEPVLSPLASAIQDHLLYRRRNGLALIQNEELCAMMRNKLQSKVDDRAIRAAVAELNKAGVMLWNHGNGYFISSDPADAKIQCDIYYSHLHAYAEKIADIKRATVTSVLYEMWRQEEQVIQESLQATAEGLK